MCNRDYQVMARLVRNKMTTWDELEAAKKVKTRKSWKSNREFEQEIMRAIEARRKQPVEAGNL